MPQIPGQEQSATLFTTIETITAVLAIPSNKYFPGVITIVTIQVVHHRDLIILLRRVHHQVHHLAAVAIVLPVAVVVVEHPGLQEVAINT